MKTDQYSDIAPRQPDYGILLDVTNDDFLNEIFKRCEDVLKFPAFVESAANLILHCYVHGVDTIKKGIVKYLLKIQYTCELNADMSGTAKIKHNGKPDLNLNLEFSAKDYFRVMKLAKLMDWFDERAPTELNDIPFSFPLKHLLLVGDYQDGVALPEGGPVDYSGGQLLSYAIDVNCSPKLIGDLMTLPTDIKITGKFRYPDDAKCLFMDAPETTSHNIDVEFAKGFSLDTSKTKHLSAFRLTPNIMLAANRRKYSLFVELASQNNTRALLLASSMQYHEEVPKNEFRDDKTCSMWSALGMLFFQALFLDTQFDSTKLNPILTNDNLMKSFVASPNQMGSLTVASYILAHADKLGNFPKSKMTIMKSIGNALNGVKASDLNIANHNAIIKISNMTVHVENWLLFQEPLEIQVNNEIDELINEHLFKGVVGLKDY